MNEKTLSYRSAVYKYDYTIIDRLNTLTDLETYWDDVRKFTKNVMSCRNIGRWQCLSELRYKQLGGEL